MHRQHHKKNVREIRQGSSGYQALHPSVVVTGPRGPPADLNEKDLTKLKVSDLSCDVLTTSAGVVRVGDKLYYHFPRYDEIKHQDLLGSHLVVKDIFTDDNKAIHMFFKFN